MGDRSVKRTKERPLGPLGSAGEVRGRILDILSVSLVAVGVALWVWPMERLTEQAQGFVQGSTVVNSLVFVFLATQLTTVGVAFYAYSLSNRRNIEEHDEIEAAIDRLEGLLVEHKLSRLNSPPTVGLDINRLRENISRHRLSRWHILSLAEGVLVVLMYGWIVNEYRSNVFLQGWIGNNVPWASFLLTEYSFYIVAGLAFGILVSQLGFLRPHLRNRKTPLDDNR